MSVFCQKEPLVGRYPQRRAYIVVVLAVIVAFVGVAASMQVLVLTSVGMTSRAFDSYRQGATEIAKLDRAVTEALLAQRQVAVTLPSADLRCCLDAQIALLAGADAGISIDSIPESLPLVAAFPDTAAAPAPLQSIAPDVLSSLTPELRLLIGARAAIGPPMTFQFTRRRTVLEQSRVYRSAISARLIAVPLTRFPLAAYDLPAEIGEDSSPTAPRSDLPLGLVAQRDDATIAELHGAPGVLPYHFRRRASLASAYQYLFSQQYVDKVAEYAGVSHYRSLDNPTGTAALTGLAQVGQTAAWDLGVAGRGIVGTIDEERDAAVIFTEQTGQVIRLYDSVGTSSQPPMLILLLGPSDARRGSLTVQIDSIARPVVVVGYNIAVSVSSRTSLNGPLFLDPASSLAAANAFTAAHLSYWAGSKTVAFDRFTPGTMDSAAETIAPRVVYVATSPVRL